MAGADELLAAVRGHGLVLLQDRALVNAAQIVAGGPITGSWWTHPRAGEMYAILEAVAAHPDVLVAKLVAKKVTLIDRALWPAVLAVATAREPWQLARLPAAARRLLATLDEGETFEPTGAGAKEGTKAIELRLLARAASVHTDKGKHAIRLEPWRVWAAREKCRAMNPTASKRRLEAAVAGIGGVAGLLPWRGAQETGQD